MSYQSVYDRIHTLENEARPHIITISGPSGAGKSTLAEEIIATTPDSVLISTDYYYFDDDAMPSEVFTGEKVDYDHPAAFQLGRLAHDLIQLQGGEPIEMPRYSMHLGYSPHTLTITPHQLIVVEGIVANYPPIRALADFSICVTASVEVRLERRMARDQLRSHRTPERTREVFLKYVEPGYDKYHRANDAEVDLIISI